MWDEQRQHKMISDEFLSTIVSLQKSFDEHLCELVHFKFRAQGQMKRLFSSLCSEEFQERRLLLEEQYSDRKFLLDYFFPWAE